MATTMAIMISFMNTQLIVGKKKGERGNIYIMYQYLLRAFKQRAKFKLHCLSTEFVCCDAPQISQFHNSLMQKIKTCASRLNIRAFNWNFYILILYVKRQPRCPFYQLRAERSCIIYGKPRGPLLTIKET